MVILSSPSGVGKTTITKKIQQKYPNFKISVSHTTRIPRSNEVDGVDYHFVSKESFKKLIDQNQFYEYAKIFGNYYGTLRKTVDKDIISNDLIFDIDWQGTKQLSKFSNLKLIKIYLIPDSKEELKKLNFPVLGILRPSFLMGKRKEKRIFEKIGILFFRMISPLFLGPLKKMRPIHSEKVAEVMIKIPQKSFNKTIFESNEIAELTLN